MTDINEVLEHYSIRGYSLLSRVGGDLNLVHDTFHYGLTLRQVKETVTVQAHVTTSNLMLIPISTWEFTYPNPNIERAISQLLEIRRMARL